MSISDTQWAYAAGIMDGEGSFSIGRGGRKPNHDHPSGYYNYQLLLSLGNTNEKLIEWLIETFGGVKYLGHRSKTDRHKNGYLWRIHGKGPQREFIEGVMPYLLLKKEQAVLALEMIDTEGKNPEVRRELWIKMKYLNRKGKTVETNTPNGEIQSWISYPETATVTLPKIESELL